MTKKEYILKSVELILTPLSYLYGVAVYVRNKMFDWGILKSKKFGIPVVSIGNIAAGGTGKTPHTEYIIDLLRSSYNIGVVSRGYKRRTSGFVLASSRSTTGDIGDEPYQIYNKFGGEIKVAVCERRVEGVEKLLKAFPQINLILLDDAFQHRYIKPSTNIVLTEYSRPYYEDRLLPLGRLRESVRAIHKRADFIVVTKCPDDIKPIDLLLLKKHLDLFPYQKLCFSRFSYDLPSPVFPDESTYVPMFNILEEKDTILLLVGIANPMPLIRHLKQYRAAVKIMQYPDHHDFSRDDLNDIEETFHSLRGRYKFIITTEKDAVRLAGNPYVPNDLKQHVFYQPIRVEFITAKDDFDIELRAAVAATLKGQN